MHSELEDFELVHYELEDFELVHSEHFGVEIELQLEIGPFDFGFAIAAAGID